MSGKVCQDSQRNNRASLHPVPLMKIPARGGKCPVDAQSAMERRALASMGEELSWYIPRTSVGLIHSSLRHGGEGWRDEVFCILQTWLEKTRKTSQLSRRWYAHQPHQWQHSSQCAFWVHIWMFFLRPFSLKLYFLNEAIASTDSGEFVFLTRALKLMKFSGLILKWNKTEQRKVCQPFPDEVSNSVYMKISFKENVEDPNSPLCKSKQL